MKKVNDLGKKAEIIRLLKQEYPGYVSGETVCQWLGISRTAVWKHVQSLRQEGYQIEAQPRAGYRLLLVPDTVNPIEWQSTLNTSVMGQNLFYRQSLVSTNDVAKDLVRRGQPEGTLVLTEEQTGGKGRLGRKWLSPPSGGLYFSLILYPQASPAEGPQLGLAAAVATATAIKRCTGLETRVKWPNDILINGQKVCGILAEMGAEAERIKYLVIGIGVNVNILWAQVSGEFTYGVTSLQEQLGQKVSRIVLLKDILAEMERVYRLWQTAGFAPVREIWRQLALWIDGPVRVVNDQGQWTGVLRDIDEQGALLVETEDKKIRHFYAGEVSLRSL